MELLIMKSNIIRIAVFALVAVSSLSISPSLHAGCVAEYKKAVDNCSNLDNWSDRSICGLDAGIELAGCIRHAII